MSSNKIHNTARPAVHGHRGARGRMPENSLPAVSYAIASGADAAEIDISASADDILVIHHDLHLSSDLTLDADGNRVSKPVPIRSQTLVQLSAFDIGQLDRFSDYGKRYPLQISLPQTRIPTLAEFIDRILETADPDFILNIELKSDPMNPELVPVPDHYIDLLLETLSPYIASPEFVSRLFIQSFDWRLIIALSLRQPDVLCGLLTDQQPDGAPRIPLANQANAWTANLDLKDFDSVPHMIASTGAGVWSSQFNDLNRELVDDAHNRGLAVYCWTVNKDADMERMIGLGVDVITTDYPDRLVRLLDSKLGAKQSFKVL